MQPRESPTILGVTGPQPGSAPLPPEPPSKYALTDWGSGSPWGSALADLQAQCQGTAWRDPGEA